MNTSIEQLAAGNKFWQYFFKICSIPHPSGHEAQLRDYLIREACSYNLQYRVDKAGNLAIDRAAAPGCEQYPSIILQAHLDMVPQVAENVVFDFLRDPIRPQVEGDWVTTGGRTTLGADDGIGVALAMELLTTNDLRCGKLRAVFTVSEETGLGGAEDIDPDFLDADVLFNLDSDVPFTIGCAGSSRFEGHRILESQPSPAEVMGIKINLGGMQGGHSGVDIHRNVGSAAKAALQIVKDLSELGFALSSVQSGTLYNAIAREAEITGILPPEALAAAISRLEKYANALNSTLEPAAGKRITVQLEQLPAVPEQILTAAACQDLLEVWEQLPHGLLSVCADNSSETSCNLAAVHGESGGDWGFILLARSLFDAKRIAVTDSALQLLHDHKFSGEVDSAYCSWEPKWDAPLLKFACDIYRELTGEEAARYVIHGGLEPGLFSGMNPRLQMLSFAPSTQSVHSPQEKLSIPSVEMTRKLLRNLCEKLSGDIL